MKILLIDDHSLFAEGLRILLNDFDKALDIVCCESCEMALGQAELEKVELILLDYFLPGLCGVEALVSLRECCPNSRITVVSALDNPKDIRQIIEAGAAGFIPKTSTFAELSSALNFVLEGGTYLPPEVIPGKNLNRTKMGSATGQGGGKVNDAESAIDKLSKRQREVLMQVVQGKPNKVIARTLNISEHTVKAHISASFKLLGVKNRTEAVYAAAKLSRDDLP